MTQLPTSSRLKPLLEWTGLDLGVQIELILYPLGPPPDGRRDILQLMEDREVLLYNGLVQEHRGTSKQVGAGSEASQTARFKVILDVLDSMLGERLTGLSLLDFGCGKGDLAVYLERQGRLKTVRYIGLDAIKENIEDALGAMPSCDFPLGTWNWRSRHLGRAG